MLKADKETLEKNTEEIRYLRDDFQKFFKIAKELLPEIAETRTLKRLIDKKEAVRKRTPDLV
tara:strand:- start:170 stop:355 length:186 start_codon:yes stop_codon:yes gene_type:complete